MPTLWAIFGKYEGEWLCWSRGVSGESELLCSFETAKSWMGTRYTEMYILRSYAANEHYVLSTEPVWMRKQP